MQHPFYKSVVALGGGAGLFSLLRGLKHFPLELTAIVTIADNGGSSGQLRERFEMPPPGDIRNVIAALSESEPLIQQLFQYRFKDSQVGLAGHPVGNLLLAAMNEITGDFASAISAICKVLNVKGRILPASLMPPQLFAQLVDGRVIQGESAIGKAPTKIARVFYDKPHKTSREVIDVIENAQAIILGPGSLYTSVIANLLIPDLRAALIKSRAQKIYVANIMMQSEETRGYGVHDHIEAVYAHLGLTPFFDTVFVNTQEIPAAHRQAYIKKENMGQSPVDFSRLYALGVQVIGADFLDMKADFVRHDALKLAAMLFAHLID